MAPEATKIRFAVSYVSLYGEPYTLCIKYNKPEPNAAYFDNHEFKLLQNRSNDA